MRSWGFARAVRPSNAQAVKEVELAAAASGVKLHYLDVIDAAGIDTHSAPPTAGPTRFS